MTGKIKHLNRTSLQTLRAALRVALMGITEEYGVQVEIGNCRFNDKHATFKIELAVPDSDGVIQTKMVEEFLAVAERLGFSKDDLHKEFSYKNETYKLIGYSSRSPKYPFIVERIRDATQIKFTRDIILSRFKVR